MTSDISRGGAGMSRRGFLQRSLGVATVITLPAALVACGGDDDVDLSAPVKMGVISDPHLYDLSALGDSAELDAYLLRDRKMIKESMQIFDAAVDGLVAQGIEVLLITGDLTKDGERVNHALMADRMAALRRRGIKVFVIPGNHDVNNPDALDFRQVPAAAAERVDAAQFAQIYADCGYAAAHYRDPNSLSYVVELAPMVWLFAIDSCQYANNLSLGHPVTAGAVSAATQAWLLDKLAVARQAGVLAIGCMHHGLIEHFPGQSTFFPEYVVNGREALATALAAGGLSVVFTGHFHANDVVTKTYGGRALYDVETGSTVTAPSPYRLVTIRRDLRTLAIATSVVTRTTDHPDDFPSWSRSYLESGLNTLVAALLSSAPYSLPEATVQMLLPLIVPAMVAHYAGDETLTDAGVRATLTAMAGSADASTQMIGQFVLGLWSDPAPADNALTLSL